MATLEHAMTALRLEHLINLSTQLVEAARPLAERMLLQCSHIEDAAAVMQEELEALHDAAETERVAGVPVSIASKRGRRAA